jgi:hypothetical protein
MYFVIFTVLTRFNAETFIIGIFRSYRTLRSALYRVPLVLLILLKTISNTWVVRGNYPMNGDRQRLDRAEQHSDRAESVLELQFKLGLPSEDKAGRSGQNYTHWHQVLLTWRIQSEKLRSNQRTAA